MSNGSAGPRRTTILVILSLGFVMNIIALGALLTLVHSGGVPIEAPAKPPLQLAFAVLAVAMLAASVGWFSSRTRRYAGPFGPPEAADLPPAATLQADFIVALALAEAAPILTVVRLFITREAPLVFVAYGAGAVAVILCYLLPTALRCAALPRDGRG